MGNGMGWMSASLEAGVFGIGVFFAYTAAYPETFGFMKSFANSLGTSSYGLEILSLIFAGFALFLLVMQFIHEREKAKKSEFGNWCYGGGGILVALSTVLAYGFGAHSEGAFQWLQGLNDLLHFGPHGLDLLCLTISVIGVFALYVACTNQVDENAEKSQQTK